MTGTYQLIGSKWTGSMIVEAAFALSGIPHEVELIPYGGGNPTNVAVINGEADIGALPIAGVVRLPEKLKVLGVFNRTENLFAGLTENAPTINSAIILNDNLNISSSSSGILTVNGGITGTGGTRNLSVNGSGTIDINGVIGASMGTLTKGGTGTLILGGANTYTGATTINNGTIQLDANAPSGAAGTLGNATSAVVLGTSSSPSDANIALISAGGATGGITVGRNLTVNNFGGTTTIGGTNTGGTNTFSGTVTLNKDATLTAAAGGTVAFTGAIAGTGGIVKEGAGTVSLAGTTQNTFAGDVAINAGTLQIAKTGAGVDALPASTNRGAIGDQAAVITG